MYIKFNFDGDILIVRLYLDNLIFTDNNTKVISEFKEAMINHFEMTDLGLISYFLDIKVSQTNDSIFITQTKYVCDILKKFKIKILPSLY